jgi:hypothetical protein
LLHATNHQARAHQQEHGEGDFGNHQRTAEAAPAAMIGRVAGGLFESLVEVAAGDLRSWSETQEQAHGARDDHGKKSDSRVQAGVDVTGKNDRAGRHEGQYAPAGEQQAGGRAEARQHAAFDDELEEHPGAPGAQGDAHGDFALPGFGTRQQKIRDVGAGNQQDKCNSAQQDQQRLVDIAEELLVQRGHLDGAASLVARYAVSRRMEMPSSSACA